MYFQLLSTDAFEEKLSGLLSVATEIMIPAAMIASSMITCLNRDMIPVFPMSLYIPFVISFTISYSTKVHPSGSVFCPNTGQILHP